MWRATSIHLHVVPSGYCRPNPAAKRYSIRAMALGSVAGRGCGVASVVEGRTVRCRGFTTSDFDFDLQHKQRIRSAVDTNRKSLDILRGITWSRLYVGWLVVKGHNRLRREGLPSPKSRPAVAGGNYNFHLDIRPRGLFAYSAQDRRF